jgi:hypothetical protein
MLSPMAPMAVTPAVTSTVTQKSLDTSNGSAT